MSHEFIQLSSLNLTDVDQESSVIDDQCDFLAVIGGGAVTSDVELR